MPKRGLSTSDCEVDRAYKAHTSMVEPISFIVPRKADAFQADLFPDCVGDQPSLTTDDYFAGKNAAPKLISLADGFKPATPKEFVVSAAAAVEQAPSVTPAGKVMSDKEYQEGYWSLSKENEQLKARVRELESRMRELEASNQKMVEERFAAMNVKN